MESNNPSSDSSSGEDDEDIPYMENAGNLVFPELRPDDLWVRFSLILFFFLLASTRLYGLCNQ